MLVLERRHGEAIVIDPGIVVRVWMPGRHGAIKLQIEAPRSVVVLREELVAAPGTLAVHRFVGQRGRLCEACGLADRSTVHDDAAPLPRPA